MPRCRGRFEALLADLDALQWKVPVPATPGWRVRDVLGRLIGNCEDAAAGRLTGPPDEQMTAEQVGRHREPPGSVLLRTDLDTVFLHAGGEPTRVLRTSALEVNRAAGVLISRHAQSALRPRQPRERAG